MSTWITSSKLTEELQVLWPDLIDVWPMDKTFWCPTYFELKDALREIEWYRQVIKETLEARGMILHVEYIEGVHDCDNFALELQADISRHRMIVERGKSVQLERSSWAFGTAICKKIKGIDLNHTINICKTSDKGYILIEPQDNTMWVANEDKNEPYFVEMR